MTNRIREYLDEDLDDDAGEWVPVKLPWREMGRIVAALVILTVIAGAFVCAVMFAARVGWGK